MNIEVFVLCDAATEQGGKLNVLGAFDQIWARKTPVSHPQCTVALRMRFRRIEAGSHRVKLSMVDGDGRALMPPLDTTIQVQVPEPNDSTVTHLILNVQQLKFEKTGEYAIDLAVDGKHEGTLPLYVRDAAAAPANG